MANGFHPTSLPAADVLAGVRNGGMAVVATALRVTYFDKKTLARFEKVGAVLLKDEGTGYRLANGKSSVFLFRGQLQVNF